MGGILDLSFVQERLPQYNITESIGEGNFGYAFLTADGKVLKLTVDKREYYLASHLLKSRKKIENHVDIYECKRNVLRRNGNKYHLIIQEKVDTQHEELTLFVKAYKDIWIPDIIMVRNIDFYLDCLRNGNRQMIEQRRSEFSGKYPQWLSLYDSLIKVQTDLAEFCDKRYKTGDVFHIREYEFDLNDGNLGYSSDGVLKIFDQREFRHSINHN